MIDTLYAGIEKSRAMRIGIVMGYLGIYFLRDFFKENVEIFFWFSVIYFLDYIIIYFFSKCVLRRIHRGEEMRLGKEVQCRGQLWRGSSLGTQ